MGRPPKPTQLKIIQGDRKDRINTNEPIPAPAEGRPPLWLAGDARKIWEDEAPPLIRSGLLTSWDVECFANRCDAMARRRKATRRLLEEGELIEQSVFNRHGERTGERLATNPWFHIWKSADDQVRRYSAKFGLTPSDRSQVGRSAGEVSPPASKRRRGAERLLS